MNNIKIFNNKLDSEFILINICASLLLVILFSIISIYFRFSYISQLIFIIWLFLFIIFYFYLIIAMLKKNEINIFFIFILIFVSFFVFVFFSNYGYEGGHDPGNYFQTAVYIANHNDYAIKNNFVITFPGYSYSNNEKYIVNQFPPAFPVYLSMFYKLLNFLGIKISIIIIILLFLVLAYKILFNFIKNTLYSTIFVLFYVSNIYFWIFFRTTYIEPFYCLIVAYLCLCILLSIKNKNYLFYGFLGICIFLFTRPEGIIYFLFYLFLIIFFLKNNIFKLFKNIFFVLSFFSTILFLIVFVLYNVNYKAYFFDNIILFINTLLGIQQSIGSNINYEIYPINKYLYNILYLLIVFFPLGLLFILVFDLLFFNILKKEIKIKIFLIIFPFLIQFMFIFKSGIAYYLPWFMRRYFPIIYFFILLIFFVIIATIYYKRNISKIIVLLLISLNLFYTSSILFKKEKGAIEFLNAFSKNIKNSKNDVYVFLDRFGIENYTGTIFFIKQINTIYDRIPIMNEDIYKYLLNNYKYIYIISSKISPEKNFDFFGIKLNNDNLVDKFIFEENVFISGAEARKYVYNPKVWKGYNDFLYNCLKNNPPKETKRVIKSVFLYKINNTFYNNNNNYNICKIKDLILLDKVNEYMSYK